MSNDVKVGGGGSFANFRQICFDFAYYFILLYLSNCLIRCVCKKSFLSFSYFSMVIKKNMQNQNKFLGNSQALPPPPPSLQLNFRHCICVAIFIIYHKTTSYAHKTTSLTAETNKFQLTNMLFITFLKRCFECTVNGSLQMVVKWVLNHLRMYCHK